jgi:Protein of unknown function (DUF616)
MSEIPTVPRRAVYTALMGQYETLQEQPVARESDIPFICFTDDPSLESSTWDIRLVEPLFPLDSIRSARTLKIVGNEVTQEYDETLWIDNRVILTARPEEILDSWLERSDIAVFEHSFRDSVSAEFAAVAAEGYDDPTRVYEQLIHYAELLPESLERKPLWTGLIARRRSALVTETMELWWAHVLRYSRRDQLSVVYALHGSRAPINEMTSESNHRSEWHEWPLITESLGRKSNTRSSQFSVAIRAPMAKVLDLERALESVTQELSDLRRDSADYLRQSKEYEVQSKEYERQSSAAVEDLRQAIAANEKVYHERVIGLQEQIVILRAELLEAERQKNEAETRLAGVSVDRSASADLASASELVTALQKSLDEARKLVGSQEDALAQIKSAPNEKSLRRQLRARDRE